MRKLTGLFIVAAVIGTTWYYVSPGTSHPAAAQTGTPAAGNSAYAQVARRHMQRAVAFARQGQNSQAKLEAIKASRFNVQWGEGELTPSQLLSQVGGNQAPPRTINPATARTQTLPRRAAPTEVNPVVVEETEYNYAAYQPADDIYWDGDWVSQGPNGGGSAPARMTAVRRQRRRRRPDCGSGSLATNSLQRECLRTPCRCGRSAALACEWGRSRRRRWLRSSRRRERRSERA